MRHYAYLDHIRWMTVLLVIVYHVCYLFNGVGIFGGVPNARNLPFLDTISGTVYPWFMVLLFVVAGMCARFALVQQGNRAFLRNRARKLLVPSRLANIIVTMFLVHKKYSANRCLFWLVGMVDGAILLRNASDR